MLPSEGLVMDALSAGGPSSPEAEGPAPGQIGHSPRAIPDGEEEIFRGLSNWKLLDPRKSRTESYSRQH
jgi:hypothetical protein